MEMRKLSEDEIKGILESSGALLSGHFLLTSGRHSGQYIQCAQVLKYPRHCETLGRAIAAPFAGEDIDLVIGPALGGVIIAYEVARVLDTQCLFTERENGKMTLRRGFRVKPGDRVLVVEDVVTTGGSVMEVMDVVRGCGGEVAGVGVIVDRSGGKVDFGVRKHALLTLDIATYTPEKCPLCIAGEAPPIKPGSRNSVVSRQTSVVGT
ncbi:MAG: orotate phosphoribosyltransferase [Bacillota bacterium]